MKYTLTLIVNGKNQKIDAESLDSIQQQISFIDFGFPEVKKIEEEKCYQLILDDSPENKTSGYSYEKIILLLLPVLLAFLFKPDISPFWMYSACVVWLILAIIPWKGAIGYSFGRSIKAGNPAYIQSIIEEYRYDYIIQPQPAPPKKLLISDMDSTMIEQECIDELADFVGKKAHVAAITERAMNGELVFEDALRERVALLKGLSVDVLQQCFDERITAMGGAKELVAAFKKQGGKCVLVSGGFTFFTERVAKMLGFDEHYANILEIENGKLTGKVREPILGKEAKLAELHRQCELLGITPENVLAIGDGANDVPMLKAAGLGIAYHAKPTVQAQLNARINHGDLSSVIHVIPA